MKTFSAKPEEVRRDWFVVDATDKILGRLAAEVSEADSNIDHIETEQRASPSYTTIVFTIQVKHRMHLAHVFRRLRRIPELTKQCRCILVPVESAVHEFVNVYLSPSLRPALSCSRPVQ